MARPHDARLRPTVFVAQLSRAMQLVACVGCHLLPCGGASGVTGTCVPLCVAVHGNFVRRLGDGHLVRVRPLGAACGVRLPLLLSRWCCCICRLAIVVWWWWWWWWLTCAAACCCGCSLLWASAAGFACTLCGCSAVQCSWACCTPRSHIYGLVLCVVCVVWSPVWARAWARLLVRDMVFGFLAGDLSSTLRLRSPACACGGRAAGICERVVGG